MKSNSIFYGNTPAVKGHEIATKFSLTKEIKEEPLDSYVASNVRLNFFGTLYGIEPLVYVSRRLII